MSDKSILVDHKSSMILEHAYMFLGKSASEIAIYK